MLKLVFFSIFPRGRVEEFSRTLCAEAQYNELGELHAQRGIFMKFAKIQQIVADNPFTLFLILVLLLLADSTGPVRPKNEKLKERC